MYSYNNINIYSYIYICNIQSASEDSGCRLFLYRIYEDYHINMSARCMAIVTSLIILQVYNKIHIQSIYSAIRRKLKPD